MDRAQLYSNEKENVLLSPDFCCQTWIRHLSTVRTQSSIILLHILIVICSMQRLSTTQQQYPFGLNGAHKVGFGAQNSNKTKVLNECMYSVQSRVHSKWVAVALLLECWSVLRWCQIKSLINSKLQNMAKGHPYNVFFSQWTIFYVC